MGLLMGRAIFHSAAEIGARSGRGTLSLSATALALDISASANPDGHRWNLPPKTRFAPDSPLEQRRFEPSVPSERRDGLWP